MTRCALMMCKDDAKGLVRFFALRAEQRITMEAPMCQHCSDLLAVELEHGAIPHVTPGGTVYLDNLDRLLKQKPA